MLSIEIFLGSYTSDLINFKNRTFIQRSKKALVRDEPALLRTSLFGERRFVFFRFKKEITDLYSQLITSLN